MLVVAVLLVTMVGLGKRRRGRIFSRAQSMERNMKKQPEEKSEVYNNLMDRLKNQPVLNIKMHARDEIHEDELNSHKTEAHASIRKLRGKVKWDGDLNQSR
jgi:deoxyadenosine/deoxycytidine kinase